MRENLTLNNQSETPKTGFLVQGIYGPRRDKTCLRGFGQSEIQTSPRSYRDYIEN